MRSSDAGRALGRPLIWGDVEGSQTATFALPAGTVTFLLSDIEGSTRLWQDEPEAMALAVPEHYALLEEAVALRGGLRPVEPAAAALVLRKRWPALPSHVAVAG